jgi:hypothetical protein
MLRDNAWTVAGIREEPERVTCADFASLKVPVLLVRGELTTPYFKRIVEEQGDLPGFFGPVVPGKMALRQRGAHEEESIHG